MAMTSIADHHPLQGDLERLTRTVEETAHILGVSRRTIDKWINDGTLRALPNLRTKMITTASIDALLSGGEAA